MPPAARPVAPSPEPVQTIMLKRFLAIAAYNRDWSKYLTSQFSQPRKGQLLHFRLRNGQRLSLPADTRFLLNEIYLDKVYDLPGVDYGRCSNVLDLGGNVGLYALYVAAVNPHARIFSFEPSSENLALLRRNLERNPRQADRIDVFPMAVGSYNGTATLSLDRTSAEYSIVHNGEEAHRTEQVRCVDLATALDMMHVDEFDLVKIDIEGAEADLLRSASDEQLRRFKAIVLEWHYSLEALEDMADRFRFTGFDAKLVLLAGHMRFLHAYRRS